MSAADDEVPQADALEQAAEVEGVEGDVEAPPARPAGVPDDLEVPEGDALEQAQDVPGDDDYPHG
jgi:hypothetical protein